VVTTEAGALQSAPSPGSNVSTAFGCAALKAAHRSTWRCVLPICSFGTQPFLGRCFKKFWASVNYLTSGQRRTPYWQAQRDVEGMQMLAWIIAVVVAIGLIWSVAAMSNLIPVVDGSDSAPISRPAE
jgi:hypothetical protein